MKLYLVSLGCAKNFVDSEAMQGRLTGAGWVITQDPSQAHVIIVNTCSFIESAIDESVDTILELAKFKEHGSCRNLIVAGCLPQRFGEDIAGAMPEVDIFLGTGAFDSIVEAAGIPEGQESEGRGQKCFFPDPNLSTFDFHKSNAETPALYLKIAEGCSKHCTYCIIPKLRGRQRSRFPEDIVSEARSLVESGAKELILVAQDTTNYGKDLKLPTATLGRLLERISDISGDIWVRFLYGHPESMDESLIITVAARHNISSYFDIPIQHASDSILKQMGRDYSREDLYRLFDTIRSHAPDASLRTTVITGFPGETDKDFESLLRFAEKVRFNHLGAFIYSDSQDLPSHSLSDHVPERVAKERYERLMSLQTEISLEHNQNYMGKILEVLVEENPEENLFTGRTSFQAPEVDGITYIHQTSRGKTGQLQIGRFASVRVTDALEYDLIGETA